MFTVAQNLIAVAYINNCYCKKKSLHVHDLGLVIYIKKKSVVKSAKSQFIQSRLDDEQCYNCDNQQQMYNNHL